MPAQPPNTPPPSPPPSPGMDRMKDKMKNMMTCKKVDRDPNSDKVNKFVSQLVGPYQPEAFWFEIFEGLYKVSTVGLAVFYEQGTIEQHLLGIMLCYTATSAYHNLKPFQVKANNYLAQLTQLIIILTIISGMIIIWSPNEDERSSTLSTLLCFCLFFSAALSIALGLFEDFFNKISTRVLYEHGEAGRKFIMEKKFSMMFKRSPSKSSSSSGSGSGSSRRMPSFRSKKATVAPDTSGASSS